MLSYLATVTCGECYFVRFHFREMFTVSSGKRTRLYFLVPGDGRSTSCVGLS